MIMESKNVSVNVMANPRIHLGLLDCGYATPRQYGGVGFLIDGIPTTVSACAAREWHVDYAETATVSQRTRTDVEALLHRMDNEVTPSCIRVITTAPEHIGLGSKTSLLMAITASAFATRNEPMDRTRISSLTQRGGASGLGVNLFWQGGLIADGGHRVQPAERIFNPSYHRTPDAMPPVITRIPMPPEWNIVLFADPTFPVVEGAREVALFQKHMPITEIQCLTALALAYHGILPSVIEHDLPSFAENLKRMNGVGMKSVEVSEQTPSTRAFLRASWDEKLAAGLSSVGHCTFVVARKDSSEIDQASALASQHGLTSLGIFRFRNCGAFISQDNSRYG